MIANLYPPPAYIHPYRGPLTEYRMTLTQIEYFCHTVPGISSPYNALGCARIFGKRCVIMIPKIGGMITAQLQRDIRRHELAHCNGWGEDHPSQ